MRCGCSLSKLSCFALVRPPSTTGSVSLDGSWFALGHPVRGKLSLTFDVLVALCVFFLFYCCGKLLSRNAPVPVVTPEQHVIVVVGCLVFVSTQVCK